ncbi:MAG: HAMP domain-containing sensor histidine kinase [Deltaproteobacteria bacterium]|nr:HAMP domain-containing sensor histidine kinase [Deltaproteobacteria bacterium]
MTFEKTLEAESERLFKELEGQTMSLNEANVRLQELDKVKSDFLSTVSHELRTPLTSILGFAKIIKNRLEGVVIPEVKSSNAKVQKAVRQVLSNVGIILSEAGRLTSIINDVLDLAKLEAGRVDWKLEKTTVSEIIDRSVNATTSLFDHKDLRVVKDIEEGLPTVVVDADKLMQVVINLLSNAVKFTEKGNVTCRARFSKNEVVISVVDTGIGISKEDQPKVFEKFKQVGDTLTERDRAWHPDMQTDSGASRRQDMGGERAWAWERLFIHPARQGRCGPRRNQQYRRAHQKAQAARDKLLRVVVRLRQERSHSG